MAVQSTTRVDSYCCKYLDLGKRLNVTLQLGPGFDVLEKKVELVTLRILSKYKNQSMSEIILSSQTSKFKEVWENATFTEKLGFIRESSQKNKYRDDLCLLVIEDACLDLSGFLQAYNKNEFTGDFDRWLLELIKRIASTAGAEAFAEQIQAEKVKQRALYEIAKQTNFKDWEDKLNFPLNCNLDEIDNEVCASWNAGKVHSFRLSRTMKSSSVVASLWGELCSGCRNNVETYIGEALGIIRSFCGDRENPCEPIGIFLQKISGTKPGIALDIALKDKKNHNYLVPKVLHAIATEALNGLEFWKQHTDLEALFKKLQKKSGRLDKLRKKKQIEVDERIMFCFCLRILDANGTKIQGNHHDILNSIEISNQGIILEELPQLQ